MSKRHQLLSDIDFKKDPAKWDHLLSEKQRTKAGIKTLSKVLPIPEGSNEVRLIKVLQGKYRYVSVEEYSYLIKAFDMLPNK